MFMVKVITNGTNLTPLQQRNAFRSLGYPDVPDGDAILSADVCFKFWVIMLLGELKFLAPEQRSMLFDELSGDLEGHGEQLHQAIMQESEAPTPMLAFADGKFATWHNRKGWLDLKTGHTIKDVTPPLETVAYNLAVLFGRNSLTCQKIQRRMESQDASNTVDPSQN